MATPPELPGNLVKVLLTSVGIAAIAAWLLVNLSRHPKSRFKLREADRPKRPGRLKEGTDFFQRRNSRPATPDRPRALPGIRINVPPHELLGVPLDATQAEIKRAYKRLMKQYHPDSVAAPGTSQWQEAQKIAAALNEAKETLLKTAKR